MTKFKKKIALLGGLFGVAVATLAAAFGWLAAANFAAGFGLGGLIVAASFSGYAAHTKMVAAHQNERENAGENVGENPAQTARNLAQNPAQTAPQNPAPNSNLAQTAGENPAQNDENDDEKYKKTSDKRLAFYEKFGYQKPAFAEYAVAFAPRRMLAYALLVAVVLGLMRLGAFVWAGFLGGVGAAVAAAIFALAAGRE